MKFEREDTLFVRMKNHKTESYSVRGEGREPSEDGKPVGLCPQLPFIYQMIKPLAPRLTPKTCHNLIGSLGYHRWVSGHKTLTQAPSPMCTFLSVFYLVFSFPAGALSLEFIGWIGGTLHMRSC